MPQGLLNHPPHHHQSTIDVLDRIAPARSGIRAVRSGRWSNPSTWGGRLPTRAATIPSGVNVIFDLRNSPNLNSVRIDGCLEMADNRSTRLNTDLLYVAPGGTFAVASPRRKLSTEHTAEIAFWHRGPINTRLDPLLVGRGFVSASRVEIHGAEKKTRIALAKAPKRNDRSVTLRESARGWRVGDRIVVTGTRLQPAVKKRGVILGHQTQDEERFITRISGRTVYLSAPLIFDHDTPDPTLSGYAVNYSRNIRFLTNDSKRAKISERGHAMFMSTQTNINNAEFFELGRTDKSRRAVGAATISSPNGESNVKGRYSIHLHRTGFVQDSEAPVFRNNAVWGSPGWGIAQHDSKAFLFNNATYNTFGAGFVTESGNETGAWVDNTAIKSIGLAETVKNGPSVHAFDLARTGDGFWLQGRLVRVHKNVAAGMNNGYGFIYMHRGRDTALPKNPVEADMLTTPSICRWSPQQIGTPPIVQFTDNEAFASKSGDYELKSRPHQNHDVRNIIENFKGWEVTHGMEITYTGHVTVKDALLISAQKDHRSTGVLFGANVIDAVVTDSDIRGFDYGTDLGRFPPRLAPSYYISVVNTKFTGTRKEAYKNRRGDEFLRSTFSPRSGEPKLQFSSGTRGENWSLRAPYQRSYPKGRKTDSLGTSNYPTMEREMIISSREMKGVLLDRGYYTAGGSRKIVLYPEFYSDRLSGELFQKNILVNLIEPVFVDRVTGFLPRPAVNNGRINFSARPPTANNDSLTASQHAERFINTLSNDRSFNGKLKISGFTQAREGTVRLRPDGTFGYSPFPDFIGRDSFSYRVRDPQGQLDKATVNIIIR